MKKIRRIFSDFLSLFKELNGKKIAFIIALSVIIITPTLLATGYVIYHEIAKPAEYFSVTLYDNEDEVIAEESQTIDNMVNSSLLKLFYHLIVDERTQISPVQIGKDSAYVRAEIDHNGIKYNIKCYFSTDSDKDGYYVDAQNKYYSIPKKLNSDFLCTPLAQSFYEHARPFILTTADLDVITPKSVDWNYKTVNGQYLSATGIQTTSEKSTYEITGAIDITFEEPPDITHVQVFSNNKLIYTGTAEALSSLEVDSNDVIRVFIEAKWLAINHREYHGTTTYEFFVHIKNRASFSISSDTVRAGGFIFLDCSNVNDIKKLNVTSSRDGFVPVFKPYNNRWRTVIPFPEDTEETSLDITFSYGATSESFFVKVLPSAPTAPYETDEPIYNNTYNPDSIKKAIFDTKLPKSTQVYFRGNFEDPQNETYVTLYSHGADVICGEDTYSAIGNKYILKDNTVSGGSVRAIQNGIVSYVGYNVTLGNYAVIDHGCGLRTWYTELCRIDVKVGDVLLSGQHIGKTAAGNPDGADGFILYCTVEDIMIDPETLWKKSE